MCGIAGVVHLDSPGERATVARMAAALLHRGVDSQGVFASNGVAMASTRLAITDPRSGGNQPMVAADGRLTIVFNGEIYNHTELRDQLAAQGYIFATKTDTEVVLAAFDVWGEACVSRFNGMWAFAIWDRVNRRLFCSRDRFGEKPFYYHCEGNRFVFASEIKALCADPAFTAIPNLSAVRDFLQYERVDHSNETFFRDVRPLEAGQNLTFAVGGIRRHRYWSLQPGAEPPKNPQDALRDVFTDSVRLRMKTSSRLGFCLSGGLDSSTLVCTAAHLRPNLRPQTFTAVFDDRELDESPFARSVIEAVDADAHWITFSAAELVQNLSRIVRTHDEPFNSTSMAAQWFVMRSAHDNGCQVMLDGQGADEVFAGYNSMFNQRFLDLLLGGRVGNLVSEMSDFRRVAGGSAGSALAGIGRAMLPIDLERRLRARLLKSHALVGAAIAASPPLAERLTPHYPDTLRSLQSRLIFGHGIPELFRSLDRNAMAHGIEPRAPYLDHRVVEIALSLPGQCMISGGRTKAVIRHAMAHVLPKKIMSRTCKLSFGTPQSRFFREELGSFAADIFASRAFAERGWVDAAHCRTLLNDHRSGRIDAGYSLWRVLNLELWANEFIDRSTERAAKADATSQQGRRNKPPLTVEPHENLRIGGELVP